MKYQTGMARKCTVIAQGRKGFLHQRGPVHASMVAKKRDTAELSTKQPSRAQRLSADDGIALSAGLWKRGVSNMVAMCESGGAGLSKSISPTSDMHGIIILSCKYSILFLQQAKHVGCRVGKQKLMTTSRS